MYKYKNCGNKLKNVKKMAEIITPNSAQEEALHELEKTIQNGKNKSLIVMPSGIGKTLFSAMCTKKETGKILYIAHRIEILQQAKKEFIAFQKIDEKDIEIYANYNKKIGNKITFASILTLSRIKNLKKIDKDMFKYIIIDEYHHAGAPSYERVLKYFKCKRLLGLTATPYRLDGKNIFDKIDYNVPYHMGLKEGIEKKLLSKFIYYGLWDNIDYSDIEWLGNKYRLSDLNKKLLIDERDKKVIQETKKRIGNRKAIGFCITTKHVNRCVEKFNEANIKSKEVIHSTSRKERKKILEDFRKNKYQILFTVDIYNEGLNIPDIGGILMLRPTFSKRVFYQQLGRGLRKIKGKKNVIILDFIGNYKNAFKRKQWLNEIMQKEGKKFEKPEYNYDVAEVHFDAKVIKLFEEQMISKPFTEEKLILIYNMVKNKIGRVPTAKDMKKHHGISLGPYRNRWRTWISFLEFMGDYKPITKEIIKEEILAYHEKHGRAPELKEISAPLYKSDFSFSKVNFDKYFSSYEEGMNYCGIDPIRYIPHKLILSKEELVKDFYKNKKRLGHVPKFSELETDYYPGIPIKKHFGTYANMLEELGEDHITYKLPTKKQLIDNYFKIKQKIKKDKKLQKKYKTVIKLDRLNSTIMHDQSLTKYSLHRYIQVFGSWPKFLREIGEISKYTYNKKITKKDMAEDYHKVRKEKGRPVYFRETNISGTKIKKHYGTYTKFKEEMEKKYPDKKADIRKKLIENYYRLKKEIKNDEELRIVFQKPLKKNILTARAIDKKYGSDYTVWYYVKEFGSWTKFLREINEINEQDILTKEKVIKKYIKKRKKLGKTPTIKEIGIPQRVFKKYFGSYTKMQIELGDTPNKAHKNNKIVKDKNTNPKYIGFRM